MNMRLMKFCNLFFLAHLVDGARSAANLLVGEILTLDVKNDLFCGMN